MINTERGFNNKSRFAPNGYIREEVEGKRRCRNIKNAAGKWIKVKRRFDPFFQP